MGTYLGMYVDSYLKQKRSKSKSKYKTPAFYEQRNFATHFKQLSFCMQMCIKIQTTIW